MVAEEAGLAWEIIPTDPSAPEHQARHPFGKAPAVELNGERFYESAAICQYIDDVYNDGALQPDEPLQRARMAQWISVANAYVFPTAEYGLVLPRLVVPMMGGEPREDLIEAALPKIAYQMTVVSNRLEEASYLAGPAVSLADLFMFGVLRPVQLTPEGRMIFERLLPLRRWVEKVGHRPSAAATRWDGEPD